MSVMFLTSAFVFSTSLNLCIFLKVFNCHTDVLTRENIKEPMRDIRRALLEADVASQSLCRLNLSMYELDL